MVRRQGIIRMAASAVLVIGLLAGVAAPAGAAGAFGDVSGLEHRGLSFFFRCERRQVLRGIRGVGL